MKKLILTILAAAISVTCFGTTNTALFYVRTGNADKDAVSMTDLTGVVSKLNVANAANNHTYSLHPVDTFAAASTMITNAPIYLPPNTTATVGISHGIYNVLPPYEYQNTLKEVGGAVLDTDGEAIFMKNAHCGADGKINADQVGAIAASAQPGDTFPTAGAGGGGGGTAFNGHYEYSSGEVWVFFIGENGHLGSILVTYNIAQWVPDENSPGDHDAERGHP